MKQKRFVLKTYSSTDGQREWKEATTDALAGNQGFWSRNLTLRPDPSTDNQAITTIGLGQRLSVVSVRKRNGYLHVSVSKEQGWVWVRNVDVLHFTTAVSEKERTETKGARNEALSSWLATPHFCVSFEHV